MDRVTDPRHSRGVGIVVPVQLDRGPAQDAGGEAFPRSPFRMSSGVRSGSTHLRRFTTACSRSRSTATHPAPRCSPPRSTLGEPGPASVQTQVVGSPVNGCTMASSSVASLVAILRSAALVKFPVLHEALLFLVKLRRTTLDLDHRRVVSEPAVVHADQRHGHRDGLRARPTFLRVGALRPDRQASDSEP